MPFYISGLVKTQDLEKIALMSYIKILGKQTPPSTSLAMTL